MLKSASLVARHRVSLLAKKSARALSSTSSDKEMILRQNVTELGKILGYSIKGHDPAVFSSVEKLRALGKEWRKKEGNISALEDMVTEVKSYDNKKLLDVSRSFANFLALANSAENHHRIRRLKSTLLEADSPLGLWPKKDSCGGAIQDLVDNNVAPNEIIKALCSQKVEIVLTAHPTEVNRRTMLKFHGNIKVS